ncbi:MAG: threonine synthase [Candidatus Latescibacteria bacterium]|nr:threonine synthase [Candidatus Latescibacterota bacterium]
MDYKAWFQCIDGCPDRYDLNEIIYRCRRCGGLLEVVHDLERLKNRGGAAWIRLFDDRYKRTEYPYGSAVWGKKEWVCPAVANENVVSMYEGGSNLFWAERLGKELGLNDLWVKQCGNNHTGSFKDLGMTVLVSMVNQMIKEGQDIRGIACASTGDTSASLAAYCAYAGIPAIVFLPKNKVSTAQLLQPIANGAITISLDTDFDGCMEIVQQVSRQEHIYLANSMNSLRIEGQKTVGMEIIQQFDWEVPDVIIIPGGNLGNVTALGKGFLMMQELGVINRLPRIVCAQAAKANPLYRSYLTGFQEYQPIHAEKTIASAIQIGNPVSINRAIKVLQTFNGIVEQATEDEIANAAARGDLTGLFNCPHTGVALAALFKLVERGDIQKGDRVVVISTANGLKFTDFKIRYHEGQLDEVTPRYQQHSIDLPPRYDDVARTLEKVLRKRKGSGVRGQGSV